MSSNSLEILVGVGIAVGLLLFGIGTAMLRSMRELPAAPESMPEPVPAWPHLIDESIENADAQMRKDMIERLGLLNTPWSRDVLERAKHDERDPAVLEAIDAALGG